MSKPSIEVKQPVWLLTGLTIDYGLTPARAKMLLPKSGDCCMSHWGQNEWNGERKTGIIKNATIPIIWTGTELEIAKANDILSSEEIGYVWPVEIASLLLPVNEPNVLLKQLMFRFGLRALFALRPNREEYRWSAGGREAFILYLNPYDPYFCHDNAARALAPSTALPGAPRLPLGNK